MHDSAVLPCFHGCPALLHRHFSAQSPPSHSFNLFFCSQQQPLWGDSSTIPKLQLPATVPSAISQPLCCMAAARTVCFLFHLGCHRSAVPLSALTVSLLTDNCPDVGIGPLLHFLHLPRAGPVLLKLLFFPLVLFILLSFAWVYIFFSAGQVLLSTFSWCSAFTFVSEGVFLMCSWRETYSMSTYSSTILFFPISTHVVILQCVLGVERQGNIQFSIFKS